MWPEELAEPGWGAARPPQAEAGYGRREALLAASPGELPDTQSTCLRSRWQLNWNRKFAL